ncbi:MAG TPA: hypothetical protein VG755_07885, partial [Nannocystaceae bacterium]|nr:hypothetical protein [Nannocystaceae bacterium]
RASADGGRVCFAAVADPSLRLCGDASHVRLDPHHHDDGEPRTAPSHYEIVKAVPTGAPEAVAVSRRRVRSELAHRCAPLLACTAAHQGAAALRLRIDPRGHATTHTRYGDEAFGSCVARALAGVRWPVGSAASIAWLDLHELAARVTRDEDAWRDRGARPCMLALREP